MSYMTFAEQALHYFDRPHECVHAEPIDGPQVWRGIDMPSPEQWLETLEAGEVEELEAAARSARANCTGMHSADRADFPIDVLAPRIARWREQLADGLGLVLVRGLPVERWGDELAAWAYWGLGMHLGRPGAQNPAEELLGHVTDTGDEAEDPNVRRYRTSGDIRYHCDLADVVGLLCLRTAKSGGASRIVSSVSVYNQFVRERPDLVARLYEPFLLDTRGEDGDGGMRYAPIPPCRYGGGKLRTFFHSDYFRSVVRHEDVAELGETELAVLDTYEDIASRRELRYDMELQVGDIQLLSNHFVLHARSAYEDYDEPERKRHLLRLWLSLG